MTLRSDASAMLQAENDARTVDDAKRIRATIHAKGKDAEGTLEWTELHDALTSMQAHGKRIPDALQADDLDMINARVRATPLSSWCMLRIALWSGVLRQAGAPSHWSSPDEALVFSLRSRCVYRRQRS